MFSIRSGQASFLATGIAGSLATPAPTVSFGQRERVCQMRDIDPA